MRNSATTALLPTLITTRARSDRGHCSKASGKAAAFRASSLHLEGPASVRRAQGGSDPALIRPMGDDDLAEILLAAKALGRLMLTVAPGNATREHVRRWPMRRPW